MNLRYTIAPEVIFQEVQLGESLLLNVATVTYFAFDPLGTRIWQVMQSTDDADQVLQSVAAAGGLAIVDLERKLRGILAGLERSGLIALKDWTGSSDQETPARG